MLRGLLTLSWLMLAGVAFAIWDCASALVGDPLGLCPVIDTIDVPQSEVVAAGLFGVSLVGMAVVWVPYLKSTRRQRRAQPERVLIENIGRLPEPYSDLQPEDDLSSSELVAQLTRRVEVVETAFANETSDSRSLTSEWMRLLQDANRLHNEGKLPTDKFKILNTRLLDVVGRPAGSRRPVESSKV